MKKVFAVLIAACILVLISCQGGGVSKAEFEQVKQEIKYLKEYVSAMKAYSDSMRTIQTKLWEMNWENNPKQMEKIFGGLSRDTFPKPPPPPPPPIEKAPGSGY